MTDGTNGYRKRHSSHQNSRPRKSASLEPLSPNEGVRLYLREKQREYATKTIETHDSRLVPFRQWCAENSISNLNTLTGRSFHEYKLWLRENRDLVKASEKSMMDTLRVYIRWAEAIDAVRTGLSEKVVSPSLAQGEHARDEMLEHERAQNIISYLDRYRYASAQHVLFLLFTRSAARLGAVHGLDTSDYVPGGEAPHLKLTHRPPETPLKNQERGERHVFLDEHTAAVLEDYLEAQRQTGGASADGRAPLVTTKEGRMATTTIRKRVYSWTRPCMVGRPCPHDRTPEDCEAAQRVNQASKCPSSLSPHAARRGALTHQLRQGVPRELLSDRADVSEEVLEIHYDQRSKNERMHQRKALFERAHEQGTVYGGE